MLNLFISRNEEIRKMMTKRKHAKMFVKVLRQNVKFNAMKVSETLDFNNDSNFDFELPTLSF